MPTEGPGMPLAKGSRVAVVPAENGIVFGPAPEISRLRLKHNRFNPQMNGASGDCDGRVRGSHILIRRPLGVYRLVRRGAGAIGATLRRVPHD